MTKEQINVWLEEELIQKVDEFAEHDKRTRTNMMSYLLEIAIIEYKKGVRL